MIPESPIEYELENIEPDKVEGDVRSDRRQARRERLQLLVRRPSFIIGSFILLFWIVSAVAGSRITPFDPLSDFDLSSQAPNASHWFGTDVLGRDVLSRVMAGSRDVLILAPAAAIAAVVMGTILGLVTGYYGGVVDEIIGRVIEAILSLPAVLLALLVVVAIGNSRPIVIGTIAVLFTPVVTRTVRTAVINEARLDYVESARLRGEGGIFIMFREILPNVTGVIVVELTVRLAYAVFTVATLSFLGAGIQPPAPDWGLSIADNYGLIQAGQWWPTLFPALAIASLVIAANLIADSVESVLAS